MKIYNRSPGRVICLWNAEDKLDDKGQPVAPLTKYVLNAQQQTPDLPPKLAEKLLKEWKKKFSADKKAMEAELALQKKLEAQNQALADHENHLREIKMLLAQAGDTKNKKVAQAAAEKLDELLARGPGPKAAEPAAAPDPLPVVESPEEPTPAPAKDDFESKG